VQAPVPAAVKAAPVAQVDVFELPASEVRLPHLLAVGKVAEDDSKDVAGDFKVESATDRAGGEDRAKGFAVDGSAFGGFVCTHAILR
jgi:hypothetical protein